MSTHAELRTPTDLERNSVRPAVDALNNVLADSYALYFKTKNFHWHTVGPHFRDHHLMFDEQAAQILGTTDAMAERVRKIGGTTLRSVGSIARLQRIEDSDAEHVTAEDMLTELHQDNLKMVEYLREAKEAVDAANDNATAGMLDGWMDQAEGRAWFLFAASRGN